MRALDTPFMSVYACACKSFFDSAFDGLGNSRAAVASYVALAFGWPLQHGIVSLKHLA